MADQKIQVVSRLGTRVSPHCTATGKVFLAFIDKDQRSAILKNLDLEKMTPNTITNMDGLEKELTSVSDTGIAVDREEWTLGLKCVAAPIRDYYGKVQGALSVSGPADRMSDNRIKKEIVPAVQMQAMEASKKLGYLIGKVEE